MTESFSPPAPQQRLVPVEIDRKKHKHVLDVWNRSMEDMSSLDQTWPRLVEAISTPEPGTEYPCALSETTTNQRAACREDGSADSSKPNGSQDSPAAAHQTPCMKQGRAPKPKLHGTTREPKDA